jgi:hypothetical protein
MWVIEWFTYIQLPTSSVVGASSVGLAVIPPGQFFSSLRVLKSPELGIVFELTSILSRGIGQFIRTTLKAVV